MTCAISSFIDGGRIKLYCIDSVDSRSFGSHRPSVWRLISLLKDTSLDLIILDIFMPPGIDGLITYKRICDFHPGQKVIIVSCFS